MTRLTSTGFARVMATLLVAPVNAQKQAITRTPDDPAVAWGECPDFMPEGCQIGVIHDGQDPVVLTPGAYAYEPAQKPHSATCRSSGPCAHFIALVDPLDAMEGAPR